MGYLLPAGRCLSLLRAAYLDLLDSARPMLRKAVAFTIRLGRSDDASNTSLLRDGREDATAFGITKMGEVMGEGSMMGVGGALLSVVSMVGHWRGVRLESQWLNDRTLLIRYLSSRGSALCVSTTHK